MILVRRRENNYVEMYESQVPGDCPPVLGNLRINGAYIFFGESILLAHVSEADIPEYSKSLMDAEFCTATESSE